MSNAYHPDPLIAAAVLAARRSHPYYAGAIDALRIVRDDRVPTFATSAQWVTHYNPAFAAKCTDAERGAILVHELEHLMRRHHERCGARNPGRWNRAGDAEINQALPGLPEGGVYPESLGMPRGATAEAYYGATAPEPEPEPGDGGGSGDGPGEPGDSGAPGEPGDGAGQGGGQSGEPGDAPAACGSAAGGPVQEHERDDARNPGDGAADGGAEARRDAARRVYAAGDTAGTELRTWAESELGIDRAAWYSALATVVGRTLAPYGAPTRWRWPGRRDIRDMGGAMVPRWTGERPSCAVILDTSDSITPEDLNLARAAGHYLGRIADVTYYTCTVVAVNLGATLPEYVRGGGGGTNMRRGIDAAIADGARAVVVITDCYTPWGADAPAVPVIVGANLGAEDVLPGGKYHALRPQPDWATVIPVVAR